MNNNYDGRYGELAHQSTVVIQCTHDLKTLVNCTRVKDEDVIKYRAAGPTLDPATTRIDVGDLVFQCGTSRIPRGNLLNNAIPAISTLNGLYIPKNRAPADVRGIADINEDPNKEGLVNQALSESIRFLGLALNPTVPNPENEEEQHTQFTVRTQGTGKVYNTGTKDIKPGETLVWDLPTYEEVRSDDYKKMNERFGFAAQKVVLKVMPLDEARNNFNAAVMEALNDVQNPNDENRMRSTAAGQYGLAMKDLIEHVVIQVLKGASNAASTKTDQEIRAYQRFSTCMDYVNKDISKITNSALKAFMKVQADVDRRKIGKALSYARPGSHIDVLLGTN